MEQLSTFCEKGARRIGILGGTFDPIHEGHIQLCRSALAEFSLDCVLLLVSGRPPHKGGSLADAEDRYAMAALVAEREHKLVATRMEIDRPGQTYTVDTLKALRQALPAQTALYYIIGADTLLALRTWARADDVFSLTNFICFSRPGLDDGDVLSYVRLRLRGYSGRIFFASEKGPEISSTLARRRVSQGLNTSGLLPDYVRAFIDEKRLYQNHALRFEEARDVLQKNIGEERFLHTLGVIEAAESLAACYGEEIQRARWAALLHDCAKDIPHQRAEALCKEYGLDLDYDTLCEPALLHAPLGAALAKRDYDMHEPDILEAIACHTTGKRQMKRLDKIVYMADVIEPNRDFEGLEPIRAVVRRDLDAGMLASLNASIQEVLRKGRILHPHTIEARNDLIKNRKQ